MNDNEISLSENLKINNILVIGILVSFLLILFNRENNYIVNIVNYSAIHVILELFSIVVSLSIALLCIVAYPYTLSKINFFLGMAFLITGVLDLMHTLSIEGMPFFVFGESGVISAYFWIIARLTETVALLMYLLNWIPKKPTLILITPLYLFTLIFIVLNRGSVLPLLLNEHGGVTDLKIRLEYCISVIDLISIVIISQRFFREKQRSKLSLIYGLCFILCCELIFALYGNPYDIDSFIGHIYKFIGYFFILKCILTRNIHDPYLKANSSEKLFNQVFQTAPVLLSILRKSDHQYIEINGCFLKNLSLSRNDVIGKTPEKIGIPAKEWRGILNSIEKNNGSIRDREINIAHKKFLISAEQLEFQEDECLLFTFTDISDIKQMQEEIVKHLKDRLSLEEELAKRNQQMADILLNMGEAFYVLDRNWRFIYFNKEAERLLKRNCDEMIGKCIWHEYPQAIGQKAYIEFNRAVVHNNPIVFETECNVLGFSNEYRVYPTSYGLAVYFRDITERKMAENSLRTSEERFNMIFRSSPVMMLVIEKENGRYIDVNNSFVAKSGYSWGEIVGKTYLDLEFPDEWKMLLADALTKRSIPNVEIPLPNKEDGSLSNGCALMSIETIELNGEDCFLVSLTEITELKRLQNEISMSEERFAKAFHVSPSLKSIIRDSDLIYVDVNQRFLDAFKLCRTDIIGKTPNDIGISKEMQHKIFSTLRECGEIANFEMPFSEGLSVTLLLSAVTITIGDEKCYLMSFNDITELKQIQSQVTRLDRLNLVGQMAAGIGHEIRNPMTTVRGYLQLMGMKEEFKAKRPTFEIMISELDRANSIITEFLSLAKVKPTELRNSNLNNILNKLYPLIEADAFTQNKQVQFVSNNIPDIPLNEKEITQLVLNLCRNGLEAMEERGCLSITTFIEKNQIVLCIKDEGDGISDENITNIGTPFFTTKKQGTGLGLATCYRIAESHNASIDFVTSPSGTTFFIRFSLIETIKYLDSATKSA